MRYDAVSIAYGEIAVKSWNVRRRLEKLLERNIKAALKDAGIRVLETLYYPGRIYVHVSDPLKAVKVLRYIPGVTSAMPCVRVDADIDSISEAAAKLLQSRRFLTFAVRTQRIDKTYPLKSIDVNREVGAYLKELYKARVDLKSPEVEIFVELVRGSAYVSTYKIRCIGGLPVGSEGRAVVEVKESVNALASYVLAVKRGIEPIIVCVECSERVLEYLTRFVRGLKIESVVVKECDAHRVVSEKLNELGEYRILVHYTQSPHEASMLKQLLNATVLTPVAALDGMLLSTLLGEFYRELLELLANTH